MSEPKFTPGPWSADKTKADAFAIHAEGRIRPIARTVRDSRFYTEYVTRNIKGEVYTVLSDEAARKAGNYVPTLEIKAEIEAREVADAHLIAAAPRLYKALHDLLNDLSALMSSSEGVAGLHLNGDLAPWTELEPGGQFEHLGAIDSAFAALAEARGEA